MCLCVMMLQLKLKCKLTTRLHHRAFDEADEAVALETDAGAVVTTFDTDWADPG